MLEQVTAVRFDKRITSGRTAPCLLTCVRENGEDVEVVTKFSAGLFRKEADLVSEALAAMLASDLDLPVPEPFLVSFDQEFVRLVHPLDSVVAEKMEKSSRVAFGSSKLPPGFSTVLRDRPIPRALCAQAAEVFAFDALILNADRRPENANCLTNGREFAIIDHELAFLVEGVIGLKMPWEAGALETVRMNKTHLFLDGLIGKTVNFDRFAGAWQAITDERLQQYKSALPPEWAGADRTTDATLGYLAQVRNNIEPALAEVRRVLS